MLAIIGTIVVILVALWLWLMLGCNLLGLIIIGFIAFKVIKWIWIIQITIWRILNSIFGGGE